jgi:hypothetical protein
MNLEEGDVDLNIGWTKEIKEGVSATIEVASDENTNADMGVSFKAVEGDFTAAFGAQWEVNTGNTVFQTKENDGTYLAWNVMGNANTVLSLYPYELDTEWDKDTFEAFKYETQGVKYMVKLNDTTTVTGKMTIADGDTTTENVNAYKGEVSTKLGEIAVDAYIGVRGETAAKKDDVTAMGAYVTMPMGNLTLDAEFNTQTVGEADAAVGMFAKVSMAMAEMNGYMPTAYASFKTLNEEVGKTVNSSAAGAYTKTEAGVALSQGSFTVTPKVILESADKKVFGEEDKAAATDAATRVALTMAYSL